MLLALAKQEQGQELTGNERNPQYIEAAIHGGLSMKDVAELFVRDNEILAEEKTLVEQFRKKYPNIKITYFSDK